MPPHPAHSYLSHLLKFKISFFLIFMKNLGFLKIYGNLEPRQSGTSICFLRNYYIHIDLQRTLDNVFFSSSYTSSIKTLCTRPNSVTSSSFFAGPSLASLAIVSILLFGKGDPCSTSYYRTSPWESGVYRGKKSSLPSVFARVGRWSFWGVRRAPVHRGHSRFSNSFTYQWVARVSWEGRKAKLGKSAERSFGRNILLPLVTGFWTRAGYSSSFT